MRDRSTDFRLPAFLFGSPESGTCVVHVFAGSCIPGLSFLIIDSFSEVQSAEAERRRSRNLGSSRLRLLMTQTSRTR